MRDEASIFSTVITDLS